MDYEWRTEVDFPHSYLYFVELTCPRNCSDCEEGICLECDDGFALKTFRNNRTGCIPCGRRLKMKDPASFLQQCINGMFKNRSLLAKIWPFYIYYSTDSFFERPVTVTVYLQRYTLSQHTSIWLNIYFPKKTPWADAHVPNTYLHFSTRVWADNSLWYVDNFNVHPGNTLI